MTLALQLVPYNDSATLPFLLDSLVEQTDRDWTLYVLNNSDDAAERERTSTIMESYRARLPIVVVANDHNIGFAGGHQRLLEQHEAALIALLNPDAILMPLWMSDLREHLEQNSDVAAVSGHILQWDWEGERPVRSRQIDSLGLVRGADESVRDLDRGQSVDKAPKEPVEVFGVSGCLPMYRREAVTASSHDGTFFDTAYGSYKEDVDLAYRLHRSGWITRVIPTIAFHRRAFRPSHWRPRGLARREYLSYRNHWWNLLTHLSLRDMLRRGWRIAAFEAAKLGYMLLRHPSFPLHALRETRAHWPVIKAKRHWYERRS